MAKHIAVILTLLLALTGCNHSRDRRLEHLYALTESAPQAALEGLDSLNRDAFGPDDRLFYDLVALKAADKLYIRHTSDSIILPIVARFASDPVYGPEVLYYAARVYSDLGDYPTARSYFQQAIESMDSTTTPLNIQSRIFSQTGRLLNTLRLYDEAQPYVERAIELNRRRCDTINLVYNLQLLGALNLHSGNYRTADKLFLESIDFAKNLPDHHRAKSQMYRAGIKANLGLADSAVTLIRGIPERVGTKTRPLALAYACEIYANANKYDTAYAYAKTIIDSNYKDYLNNAYNVIFTTPIKNSLPADSLIKLNTAYFRSVDRFFDQSNNQLVITQQAQYNYDYHDRQRKEAESNLKTYKDWAYIELGLLIFLIVVVVIPLFFLYRLGKKNFKRYMAYTKPFVVDYLEANNDLLVKLVDEAQNESEFTPLEDIHSTPKQKVQQPREIKLLGEYVDPYIRRRETLQQRLLSSLQNPYKKPYLVPSSLGESSAYKNLKYLINKKKTISEEDPLWEQLERAIHQTSSNFIKDLEILTLNKLTMNEKVLAILIRCAIRQTDISNLLCKSNSTIGTRKEVLGNKIFGHKVKASVVEWAICHI